ncbi:MAG TPA: PRC-barrel domain containing protein [Actinomycetes bacterium]|nr:PRC-barrel domain containing protein [Actinomycetes bacterium]
MNPDMWSYRAESFADEPTSIAGYDVDAADGRIGSVDEATYEIGGSYLVIDTGGWIFGTKVMLPAGTIERIDHQQRKVYVARSQDEIKQAPEFDEQIVTDPEYRRRLGEYYGRPASVGDPIIEPGNPNQVTG